ncbi:hypothetical protein IW262DRAFT_1482264 [Armillaria fumosa]|nr:hypothetical protein IW262DRAFT_1482264 [Armillaria fumosa]
MTARLPDSGSPPISARKDTDTAELFDIFIAERSACKKNGMLFQYWGCWDGPFLFLYNQHQMHQFSWTLPRQPHGGRGQELLDPLVKLVKDPGTWNAIAAVDGLKAAVDEADEMNHCYRLGYFHDQHKSESKADTSWHASPSLNRYIPSRASKVDRGPEKKHIPSPRQARVTSNAEDGACFWEPRTTETRPAREGNEWDDQIILGALGAAVTNK